MEQSSWHVQLKIYLLFIEYSFFFFLSFNCDRYPHLRQTMLMAGLILYKGGLEVEKQTNKQKIFEIVVVYIYYPFPKF